MFNLAVDLKLSPCILLSLFKLMKRSFPQTSILFAGWSLPQALQNSVNSSILNMHIDIINSELKYKTKYVNLIV
jgi:hypothetical protein